MGFLDSIFKGIKSVVKGVGRAIKKVVKSKAFKVVAAVALAVVAPQLLPAIAKGLTTAGAWAASTIAKGATLAWSGITAAGSALMSGAQAAGSAIMKGARAAGSAVMKGGSQIFRSVTETISSGIEYLQGKIASGIDYTQEMLGFGPKPLVSGPVPGPGPKYPAGVKEPFSWKKFGKEKILDPLTDAVTTTGKKMIKEEILGKEEQQKESLLRRPSTSFDFSVTDYNRKSMGALEPLMYLGPDTDSPYLAFSKLQESFANPSDPATTYKSNFKEI